MPTILVGSLKLAIGQPRHWPWEGTYELGQALEPFAVWMALTKATPVPSINDDGQQGLLA
jgi:hypothetical protein